MKNAKYWFAATFGMLALATTAYAAGSACESDSQYFCAVPADADSSMHCLLDHQKEVSDACYNELKQRLQQSNSSNGGNDSGGGSSTGQHASGGKGGKSGGMQACKQDAESFCQGVEHGGGRIIKCLAQHQKDISGACYDFISERMQARKQQ